MDPHDLRHHNDENYTCSRLGTNLSFDKLNPSMAIVFLFTNETDYKNVITTFSNVFDTCEKSVDSFVCLEDDDDFMMVQEENEDEAQEGDVKADQTERGPVK